MRLFFFFLFDFLLFCSTILWFLFNITFPVVSFAFFSSQFQGEKFLYNWQILCLFVALYSYALSLLLSFIIRIISLTRFIYSSILHTVQFLSFLFIQIFLCYHRPSCLYIFWYHTRISIPFHFSDWTHFLYIYFITLLL